MTKKSFLDNIKWIVENIRQDNYQNYKEPLPVARFRTDVQKKIGAKKDLIYLKPKVFAKINGWLAGHEGHPEIELSYWYLLPYFLYYPSKILKDKRSSTVYHFVIDLKGGLDIVVDLLYWGEDYPQISSIYFAREKYLKNFEEIALDGGTAVPSYLSGLPPIGEGLGAGSRLSSLHQNQEVYNRLEPKSQEKVLYYDI